MSADTHTVMNPGPAGVRQVRNVLAVTPEQQRADGAAARMRKYRAKKSLLRAIKHAAQLGVDVVDVFELYVAERKLREAMR